MTTIMLARPRLANEKEEDGQEWNNKASIIDKLMPVLIAIGRFYAGLVFGNCPGGDRRLRRCGRLQRCQFGIFGANVSCLGDIIGWKMPS